MHAQKIYYDQDRQADIEMENLLLMKFCQFLFQLTRTGKLFYF